MPRKPSAAQPSLVGVRVRVGVGVRVRVRVRVIVRVRVRVRLECGSARPRFCLTLGKEGTKDGSWKEITIVSRRAGAAHSVSK